MKIISSGYKIVTDEAIDADRFQRALQDAVKSDIADFGRQISLHLCEYKSVNE